MTYSIWSRGRLIGYTDLGFLYREHSCRTGWFHPNELGEWLMPAATGVAPAMRESYEAGRNILKDPDVASAVDHEAALELELRGPDGKVIKTEDIGIIDTEYLLAIPDRGIEDDWDQPLFSGEPEMFDEEEEEDWFPDDEPHEPWREAEEFPRYQIQARLVDHNAIP